ncbi:SRPBCC family protein [Marivirga harenae]|uniref:SRPBCC family protein n=1 Tax=Marivirga harenae TaxID=2010992 RepID=UPI0026DF40BF|nr:SRPBCC family protein [Marivirga harenae]WKV12378.1 SRPBCC family protein [Marivirga harenae]|tara:strand:- start:20228 stop:20767 length:540 start_codon:yes stop_codon:yes gene_type:complete
MKILKIIGIAILGFIILALIVGAFTEKDYAVEREIVINKSQSEVFDYVKYLKNQDNFSKWSTMDPHMKKEYKGVDGTVGFMSSWESDSSDVGVGEQEILSIEEGKRIDYALRFFEPFESSEKAYIEVESVGDNQTKVIWGFKGRMDYPMNLMLLAMDFEAMLGADFEYGLQELKKILES